jgi:RNA polymerase sigma-70 factor (ECF subfamily)
MPPLYRDIFVLNRFGGMTYPEIARARGISVKTVEWRMSKALEHCASRLDV